MRSVAVVATVLALAGAVAHLPAPPIAEGPPAGFTGGFGEQSCIVCHTGNDVNAFGGSVAIDGLPEAYEPGRAYALEVRLEADETAVAGFQLTARFAAGTASGASAGTLVPDGLRTSVVDSAGVAYLQQTRAGAPAEHPNGSSWSFRWIAPAGTEDVTLHVAANSGNGDESPLGDLVYTHAVRLPARH